MAEEKNSAVPGGGGWERVTSGYRRGDALQDGPWVTVAKSGATEAGTEATTMALEVAEDRGFGQHGWAFDFYANVKMGQVACVPIPLEEATKASGLVRWYDGKGSPRAAWHLGGVFKDYRELRPKSKVKCQVFKGTGPGGLPCLIIPVQTNLGTQTGSREGDKTQSGATPGSQAAAGEESNR